MTRSKMSAMETAVRIAPARAIPVPDKGVARWPGRRGCVTGLHKKLLPAVFLLLPSFALAQPDFNSVDFRRGALSAAAADFSVPVPQALSAEEAPGFRPAPPAPEILRHDDGLINTLSPQEWARLLAGPRETEFPDLNTVTKELYSGFHIRYIAWGSLDLRATPPTFTTKAGKVFVVAKYPEWLKEAGRSCLCIEGYAEQNLFTDSNPLAFYPLTIPRRLQLKLLDHALTQASDNRMGEMYSLFYNSCTNAVVSIINGVLDEKRKLRAGWLPEIIYRLRATIPDAASALLRKKGIIGPPALTLNGTNYKQAFTILQSRGETAGATR